LEELDEDGRIILKKNPNEIWCENMAQINVDLSALKFGEYLE
jgi:hypothetical protein